MKARTAIRKTVKWGGPVTVVLLVAVWVASGWWSVSWYPSDMWIWAIRYGRIRGSYGRWSFPPAPQPRWTDMYWRGSVDYRFDWTFDYGKNGLSFAESWCTVPLWFPTVLVLIPTTLAWRADRRATRRARVGHCAACGYDRRGLASAAVCPECGAPAPTAIAS